MYMLTTSRALLCSTVFRFYLMYFTVLWYYILRSLYTNHIFHCIWAFQGYVTLASSRIPLVSGILRSPNTGFLLFPLYFGILKSPKIGCLIFSLYSDILRPSKIVCLMYSVSFKPLVKFNGPR